MGTRLLQEQVPESVRRGIEDGWQASKGQFYTKLNGRGPFNEGKTELISAFVQVQLQAKVGFGYGLGVGRRSTRFVALEHVRNLSSSKLVRNFKVLLSVSMFFYVVVTSYRTYDLQKTF